jgi:hypothetical protein
MQTPVTALIGLGVLAAFIGLFFITRSLHKAPEA